MKAAVQIKRESQILVKWNDIVSRVIQTIKRILQQSLDKDKLQEILNNKTENKVSSFIKYMFLRQQNGPGSLKGGSENFGELILQKHQWEKLSSSVVEFRSRKFEAKFSLIPCTVVLLLSVSVCIAELFRILESMWVKLNIF